MYPFKCNTVTGTIDGRDWRTYFPQPLKSSGFSWSEFARRVETIQEEKNKAQKKEYEKMKNALQSTKHPKKKTLSAKNTMDNDITMKSNPYKTINNNLNDNDDDDEKW